LWPLGLWAIFLAGCGDRLPESVGPNQEIVVLADSTDWVALEGPLRAVFEKVLFTPQEEKLYRLQHGSVDFFDVHRHKWRKNLLVVAPLDAPHSTGEFLRDILSPEVQKAVRSGGSSVGWKEDVWAEEQILLTVTGENLDAVVENLRMEADRLYHAVDRARNRRVARLIYRYGERKDVTEQLLRDYGWRVRVSFGYRVMTALPDSGFVALAKEEPSRWLFVYWEDGISPDVLTDAWCLDKRDEITRRFFDNDRIAPGSVEVSQAEFSGKIAVVMQGLWENEANWTGGPFKSYAFVDVDRDRFYLVDVGVYAPNKKKEPYLRQVDLMAGSFTLGDLQPGE
jgi:hypothetical protein